MNAPWYLAHYTRPTNAGLDIEPATRSTYGCALAIYNYTTIEVKLLLVRSDPLVS